MNKEVFSYYGDPINPVDPSRPKGGVYPTQTMTLLDVWEKIRTDKTLQDYTDRLRTLILTDGEDKYREEKKRLLPSATFGGVFDYRNGNPEKLSTLGKKGLLSYSGLIIIDIDHISQGEVYTPEELTHKIAKDPEIGVRLVFTSPSGDGIKVVCRTDVEIESPTQYTEVYNALRDYINNKYPGIVVDKSGRDITRLCLLPFDSEAILVDREEFFHPEKHPSSTGETRGEEDFTEILRDWERMSLGDGIEEIVERVEESGIDIAPDYSDYLPLVYSFTSLGERGRPLLHRVCKASPKYRKEETDRDWEECSKSTESQSIGYFINLCKSSGIDVYFHKERPQKDSRKTSQTPGKPTQTSTPKTAPKPLEGTPEERKERYRRDFLSIQSLTDVETTEREGITTPYHFKDSQGRSEALVIPSGALTLVCGKSSHGKTRLLANLSLQIATEEYNRGGEGVVLYFSFEESLRDVVERYANIAVDTHLSAYETTRNTDVLRDYFQTGNLNKSPESIRTKVLPKLQGFRTLYETGKLRLYYCPDLPSEELCELLEFLQKEEGIPIKAVFLDYVQAIYKSGGYKKDRREELREICKELNKTAISLQIPIVLSAQLNRETPNPTDMSGENIAESADITRYANTILLLWDSAKGREIKGGLSSYLNTPDGQKLQAKGFTLGESGKLYAIISKNRGGTPDVEAILEYTPETGKIADNEDLPDGDRPRTSGVIDFNL